MFIQREIYTCERVNLTALLSWATYKKARVHENIWHGEKKRRRKQALDPATEIYIISVRGALLNTVPLCRFPIRQSVGLQPYDGNSFTFDLVRRRDGGGSGGSVTVAAINQKNTVTIWWSITFKFCLICVYTLDLRIWSRETQMRKRNTHRRNGSEIAN